MLDNAEPRLAAAWHAVAVAAEVGADPVPVSLLGEHWWLSRDADVVTAHDHTGRSPAAISDAYGLIWLSPKPAPAPTHFPNSPRWPARNSPSE